MQNVLKRKNMYFVKKNLVIKNLYLDHSGYFDMHKIMSWRCPQKTGYALRRGGGAQNVTDMAATYSFFVAFPKQPAYFVHSVPLLPPPLGLEQPEYHFPTETQNQFLHFNTKHVKNKKKQIFSWQL